MQCACAILSSVAWPALQYFTTLSHIWQNLEKKVIELKVCFFIFFFQLLSETFLILRGTERDLIKNAYWSSRNLPVIIAKF